MVKCLAQGHKRHKCQDRDRTHIPLTLLSELESDDIGIILFIKHKHYFGGNQALKLNEPSEIKKGYTCTFKKEREKRPIWIVK